MDQEGYTEALKVWLRLVRGPTAAHSPQCLRVTSPQSVCFVSQLPQEIPPAYPSQSETQFNADYVFDASDSLESISCCARLDPDKFQCVVSLGNSDLLSGSQGLIATI